MYKYQQPYIQQKSILQDQLFNQFRQIVSKSQRNISIESQSEQHLSNEQIRNGTALSDLEIINSLDHQLILKQTQILEEIKQKITNKRENNNMIFGNINSHANTDILPIQSSFSLSNISSVHERNEYANDDPFSGKTKFAQQFQNSLLNSALQQVQQSCTQQTYLTIHSYVTNSKVKQYQQLQIKFNKLKERNDELQTLSIIKSKQNAQIQNQLKDAMKGLDSLQEQKKKLRLKSNTLADKQKRTHKAQMSLVFKQKLFHQGKKRYQRQKSLFLQIQSRVNKIYENMNKIWQSILLKMQSLQKSSCIIYCNDRQQSGQCWKKQVMKKCKEQLMDQRNLLKLEQQQVQKQFELMQNLSEHMRKMINQKQNSSISEIDPKNMKN